jgi:hypothetical protein
MFILLFALLLLLLLFTAIGVSPDGSNNNYDLLTELTINEDYE